MKKNLPGALLLAVAMAGCGGGGGDAGSNDAPAPAPAAPPGVPVAVPDVPAGLAVSSGSARFAFTWSPVAGATSYRLLEDLDGAGPGLPATAGAPVAAAAITYGPPGLLHTRLDAQYRVQACNAAGCSVASAPVTPDLAAAIGSLPAPAGSAADFGRVLALSADGSTLAVGAEGEDSSATGVNGNEADTGAANSGAVYVYVRGADGGWVRQAYLKASNTGAGDRFGGAVSLSADGSVLAVAALEEDGNAPGIDGDQANDSATSAGAVYVFARSASGTWAQQAYVKASHPEAGDLFGGAISLSGDGTLLAVGARAEDSAATGIGGDASDNSASAAGAAYVFRKVAGTWSQEAYLKASNARMNALFGTALAFSADGTTLAVGALLESSAATGVGGDQADTSASGAGAVYVFTRAGGTWSQQAYVKASNAQANDNFGSAVKLSADGSTLAVTAPGEASAATGPGGNPADNSAPSAGAVYVFTRTGTAWSQQAYLKASNTEAGDVLGGGAGIALSADGNTLAAGASFEDGSGAGFAADPADNGATFAGAAYIFTRSGATWSQAAYLKAPVPAAMALFGRSMALSGDGGLLVIGAPSAAGGGAVHQY